MRNSFLGIMSLTIMILLTGCSGIAATDSSASCSHIWEPVTETVVTEETGHYETVDSDGTAVQVWVVDTESSESTVDTGYDICTLCGAKRVRE